jgi:hypothetical protein
MDASTVAPALGLGTSSQSYGVRAACEQTLDRDSIAKCRVLKVGSRLTAVLLLHLFDLFLQSIQTLGYLSTQSRCIEILSLPWKFVRSS